MTLADEMDPIPCIGLCTEVIEQNLVTAAKNIPSIDDSPEEAAKKYAILGRCLRSVKEHTKEALKSVQMGSDCAAYLIMEGQKHHSLSEYDTMQVTITGPDGIEHEIDPKTALQNLDRAEKMIREGGA